MLIDKEIEMGTSEMRSSVSATFPRMHRELIRRAHLITYLAPRLQFQSMTNVMTKPLTKWALVAAGVSAVAMALRKIGRRSKRALDPGWVSEQWVVEHQSGPASRVQ